MEACEVVKRLSELYGFDYREGLILVGLDEERSLKRRGRGRPRNENKETYIRVDVIDEDLEEIEVRRITSNTGEKLLESETGGIYSETTLEMIGRRIAGKIVLLEDL